MCLAHLTEQPPDIRLRLPGIPDELAELVQRCLAKQATDRPSAAELEQTLSNIADGLRVPDNVTCALSELMSLTQSRA
jgi:serine/threonine-protein kinase